MLKPTAAKRCSMSRVSGPLGRVPIFSRPKYFQQQSSSRKVFDREGLAALPGTRNRDIAKQQLVKRLTQAAVHQTSLPGPSGNESLGCTPQWPLQGEEEGSASPADAHLGAPRPPHDGGEETSSRTERPPGLVLARDVEWDGVMAPASSSLFNWDGSTTPTPGANSGARTASSLVPRWCAEGAVKNRRKGRSLVGTLLEERQWATPQAEPQHGGSPAADALAPIGDDDDIVMDDALVMGRQELQQVSAAAERQNLSSQHPRARGVGSDVVDLVTDAFRAERDRLVASRRVQLYSITHPNPLDYTYRGKLIPPPPLAFGCVTREAIALGNEMLRDQDYQLVKKVSPSAENVFFFEINNLYQEIVLVGKACAGKSSLLNAILGQSGLAKTSSTPNTTRSISFYQSATAAEMLEYASKPDHRRCAVRHGIGGAAGESGSSRGREFYNNPNNLLKLPGNGMQLTFVDLPGFGIEGMSEQFRDNAIAATDSYLGVRRSVNTVLFCIDVTKGLTKGDVKYFTWLENLHGVFWIILTKCDAVSHARVCSVMRQVYHLITKYRRKYRKVFPFILPVSAKDGENIEALRGLLVETAGIISGDRLREILKQQQSKRNEETEQHEAVRILAIQEAERKEARRLFLDSRKGPAHAQLAANAPVVAAPPGRGSSVASEGCKRGPAQATAHSLQPRGSSAYVRPSSYLLDLDDMGSVHRPQRGMGNNDVHPDGDAARRKQELTERHMARRRTNPLPRVETEYGARFKLNTGLESADGLKVELPYVALGESDVGTVDEPGCGHEANDPAMPGTHPVAAPTVAAPRLPHSSVLGAAAVGESGPFVGGVAPSDEATAATAHRQPTGCVSSFLDKLEKLGHQSNLPRRPTGGEAATSSGAAAPLKPRKALRRELSLQNREMQWRKHGGTRVFGETVDGRLAELRPDQQIGAAVTAVGAVANRKSAWIAQQYAALARQEAPLEPWRAPEKLRQKHDRLSHDLATRGSRSVEAESHVRDAGASDPGGELRTTGVQQTASVAPRSPAARRRASLRALVSTTRHGGPSSRSAPNANGVVKRMTAKQLRAYVRNSGRIIEGFDKFENDVTVAKFMNESRQASTLRSQEQMHLNASAKINYRSMPVGLWKQYGSKDTCWPTPSVLGRDT